MREKIREVRAGQTSSSNAQGACTVQKRKISEEAVQAGFEALSVLVLDEWTCYIFECKVRIFSSLFFYPWLRQGSLKSINNARCAL